MGMNPMLVLKPYLEFRQNSMVGVEGLWQSCNPSLAGAIAGIVLMNEPGHMNRWSLDGASWNIVMYPHFHVTAAAIVFLHDLFVFGPSLEARACLVA